MWQGQKCENGGREAQVKFFERTKLERRVKQLRANLASGQADTGASLPAEIAQAEADLQVSPPCFHRTEVFSLLVYPETAFKSPSAGWHPCLQYVKYFPPAEKYVSVLKQATTPEAQLQLDKQRTVLRSLAQQRAADEALITEPDEGRHQYAASIAASQVRHFVVNSNCCITT